MSLELRKFDPRTMMGDACVIVVVGRRNSGKSVLVKDLMYYKRHIPCGIVCSGTEDGNGYYSKFVPDTFVFNHFDKPAIERIIERQRQAKLAGKAHPVFLVLDDLMFDKRFLNDKLIRYIFMNGRHFNIMLIMTAQYLVDVPPSIRSQIDFVFVLKDNQHQEKLYKYIFSIFPTYEQFQDAMKVCTESYGALVLNNVSSSTDLSDVVYYYKGKLERNFRMGSPGFWSFGKQHASKTKGSEGGVFEIEDKKKLARVVKK